MAALSSSPTEMLEQLEQARKLALGDPAVYNQIVPGILPIIGPTAPVEVRRWGAEFIAEAFASPTLPSPQKELLTSDVMPTLRSMLESQNQDILVVRSVVQAASSIYPLVFRRVISHPDQTLLWQDLSTVKLNILSRMDSAPIPVRICCVKFIQKVVQVQTPGMIADPRRPEQNETSIALVPRNHPLLPLQNIEAETSALLDRLLGVLQENSGDPIMVDATMNCLAVLIRTRPAIANKIISAVLAFNPLKQANTTMTARTTVIIKSLERTTKALLKFILRFIPNHPMEQKIHSYIVRLQQSRTALFSEAHSLKRPAEPIDGLDDAKRQRLAAMPRQFPPMPPPPHSFAHLFTLTQDQNLQQFDVKLLPADMVTTITGVLLQHIDSTTMDEAIEEIRRRYHFLKKAAQPTRIPDMPMGGPTGIDDEDDYDPEALAGSEAVIAPATEKALEELAQPVIELGPFELPKPAPLSGNEVVKLSEQTVSRVFETAVALERSQAPPRPKSGINRLAASTNDRDAWVTMMMRLATRAPAGLYDVVAAQDTEQAEKIKAESDRLEEAELPNIASRIRDTLYHYILDDWKPRLNIAISWLTEEWYSDKIQSSSPIDKPGPTTKVRQTFPNYNRWALRLLEQLIPRFDASDKNILIRFLSELPAITSDILDQVKRLARDPLTVKICLLALQYLYMMRPPVREVVIDTMEAIWQEGDADVKANTGKILNKWRPGFVERAIEQTKQEAENTRTFPNGVKAEQLPVQNVDPRKRVAKSMPQQVLVVGGADIE